MYSSSYFPTSIRSNPYNSSHSLLSQTYDYHNNQYYTEKIFDDHRLQRRMLQKPAFLIKQSALYPESNSYRIGSALDYADSLTGPTNHKYYSSTAEEQRIRVQGVNPFHQRNPYLAAQSKLSNLKKSTRSRIDTNPNLGVISYEVLHQPQPQLSSTNRRRQPQTFNMTSTKMQRPGMEDYIATSILQNSARKNTEKSRSPFLENHIIKQEENSDEDMFYAKRQTFNPARTITKGPSTLVKSKENPQQLIYKGRKYVKISV